MSSPASTSLNCPQCGSGDVSIGASGNAICTACSTLFDPTDVAAYVAPALEPFGMAPVEEVFPVETLVAEYDAAMGGADQDGLALAREAGNPESYQDAIDALVGGVATLEGGQVAEVTAFTPHDSVIVRLSTGDLEDVPLSDVVRIMPPVEDVVPVEIPDTVDALAPDMMLAFDLAKLIVRAGCESVNGTGANVTPGMPPVGYLPADPELHTVIERAAGLAVGMLIEQFELDVDQLLEWAGAVEAGDE